MNINSVNINRLYSLVSAAGENQVLNVSNDLKTLALADGSSNLSQDQVDANRKFHDGLLKSLTEITDDKDVLDEVRSKLGLPKENEKIEPKPILARDIKSAIDLVMAKVSKRIGEVLTRPFPAAVNELILEAVKANPKHEVVKTFLAKDGGTVDNLAKLCRLTFQCLKGAADSSVLAYLNGFAYKVADFENVQRVSVGDNQQYEAGVSHYEEEAKAQVEKLKAQQPVEKKPIVKKEQPRVVKFGFGAFCDRLEKDFEEKNKSKEAVFTPFIEALRADAGGDFSTRIESFLTESRRFVSDEFKTDAKCLEKLNSEIRDLVSRKEALTKEETIGILENAIKEAMAAIKRPKVFDDAVKLCKPEIENLEKVTKLHFCELRNLPLLNLLQSVLEPLRFQETEPYETASKVYTRGMRAGTDDKKIAQDVANVIKTVISRALDNGDWGKPRDVVPTDPKSPNVQYGRNTLLKQGGTNMCYLRALENALLEKGKTLPKPVDGTYAFNVTFVNGENEKGEKLTFTRLITVDADEINALKDWYAQNRKDGYERQKNDLTDLDWAVNIAQTKKEAVQNVLNKNGGNETEKTEEAKNCKIEKLSGDTISSQDVMGKYNVTNQLITETGRDDAVAALFGLTSEPASISINHAGFFPGQDQSLEGYLQSEGKDLTPESLYANFNKVRDWKKANPDGILTLNEAGRHFVAVTGFYFNGEDDFGFIVRDSNNAQKQELKVNVVGYVYDRATEGNCQKLSVHCYPAP